MNKNESKKKKNGGRGWEMVMLVSKPMQKHKRDYLGEKG
jgi:hypothetical protein